MYVLSYVIASKVEMSCALGSMLGMLSPISFPHDNKRDVDHTRPFGEEVELPRGDGRFSERVDLREASGENTDRWISQEE